MLRFHAMRLFFCLLAIAVFCKYQQRNRRASQVVVAKYPATATSVTAQTIAAVDTTAFSFLSKLSWFFNASRLLFVTADTISAHAGSNDHILAVKTEKKDGEAITQNKVTNFSFGLPLFIGQYVDETGLYQGLKLNDAEPIFRQQSDYQLIELYQNQYYGKILVLDGVLQLTEKDADAYNEMLAHVPLFQHPNPKRVLVIGGGDGYVISEVLKHNSVIRVDHVDLDGDVIEVCRHFFSWGEKAWDDSRGRVKLHVADGAKFVEEALDGLYDVIIQDSSDPWTWNENGDRVQLPSSVLYSKQHLKNLHRILSPDGVLCFQAESLQIPSDMVGIAQWRQTVLGIGFRGARYGSIMISSYPTGQIGFLMCEKELSPKPNRQLVEYRFDQMFRGGDITSYYQPKLQSSAFDLPVWAERAIYGILGDSISKRNL